MNLYAFREICVYMYGFGGGGSATTGKVIAQPPQVCHHILIQTDITEKKKRDCSSFLLRYVSHNFMHYRINDGLFVWHLWRNDA